MREEITQYYNDLAKKYDKDRFANSYGKYIHNQESRILEKYLNRNHISHNLDLGCGTGRFLEFAAHGRDISPQMVAVSKQKFPNKDIKIGDAENLDFDDNQLNHILSFHVFMHLEMEQITGILKEVKRIVKKGGYFIFDIPSQKRRKLTQYKTDGWHGANQADLKIIKEISKDGWNIVNYHGVAFFPIHRIPKGIRPYFTKLDSALSNSFFKEYSSHLIFILQKK